MRIALAQIDPCTGAFRYNLQVALGMAQAAAEEGAELVVFPEFALSGAVNEGIVWSESFVTHARGIVDDFAAKTPIPAIVGTVCGAGDPGCEAGDSGAFLCAGGRASLITSPSDEVPTVELPDGGQIAVCLGFELEYDEPAVSTRLVVEMAADTFDGPASLPTSERSLAEARERATTGQVWIAHANLAGGQDERVFSGGSYVMSADGEVVAGKQLFTQCLVVADTDDPGYSSDYSVVLPDEPDEARLWHALVVATHDYVTKNRFSDVVVGISGGIDSAVTTTLAVDALGAEHVHGVMMPGPVSSEGSVTDARELAGRLGVEVSSAPIDAPLEAFRDSLAEVCGGSVEGVALENLQARIRMITLMTMANARGWMVLNTGNKSESAVGFSTLYGDTAGGFAPLGDVYKTQVYELARWRNGDDEPIPQAILEKAPSAELYDGARDDDRLPPYDLLDAIVSRHVEGGESLADLVLEGFDAAVVQDVLDRVANAEFKRRQEPPYPAVSGASFDFRDWPITNRFTDRQPGMQMFGQ